MRTAKSMLREAEGIKKQIDSGKLKGAKLKSAKYRYYNLRYWANKKFKKAEKAFNKDQGILPHFLKQLDMVRIQEMVADRLFNEIKSAAVEKLAAKTSKRKSA